MIKRIFYSSAALAVAGVFALGAVAQNQEVTLKTTDLGGGIYMLEGVGGFAGGNIGLSVGEDGAFLIDDQMPFMSDKISAAIKSVTDKPVEYVLNTHWHGDHTGTNSTLEEGGATIVAHDNVRLRLIAGNEDMPPATASALPVITYSDTATFHWNGHEIFIYHPENAHTDGDSVLVFRDLNIIHAGDTFFSGLWPYVDLGSDGSVDGYIAAMEGVAALADDNTKIIPGHGPLSTKADLQNSIMALKTATERVRDMKTNGMSKEEILAAKPLADLDSFSWAFITSDRMVETIWNDAE